jgi:putative ABC transport system permease protein
VGDKITLRTPLRMVDIPIAGLFTRQGTAATGQGAVLLMLLKDAQILFKSNRKVDSIQIVLAPDADENAVKQAIAAKLPEGVTVDRPASRSQLAEETSLSTQQGMRMARAFSLLVAVFIITNTFLINITQRRRQIGIMRAIGATRLQIGIMVYSEAFWMGVIGSVLGFLVGVGAARLLNSAMGRLYQTTLPGIELTAWPFVLAGLVGLGVSLVGAALPARRARQLSPLEALREVLPSEIEGFTRWLTMVGIALLAVGFAALAGSVLGRFEMLHSVWASLLVLSGLVCVLPSFLGPLSAVVAAILRPWMRLEGRMARRQLLRHRARTTLTVGVVFIAISTGIGLANAVLDNVNDVQEWYRRTFVADFLVRAMAPDMATGLASDLPDGVGERISAIPGVESIEAIRLVSAQVKDESPILAARDMTPQSIEAFNLTVGEPQTLLAQLQQGEVLVGSVLAKRVGLKVGDELLLTLGEATRDFKIAGIVNEYQAGGLILFMDRQVARRELGVEGVDAYAVRVDHTRMSEARPTLEKLVADEGLLLQSVSDIQHKIDGMMAGVVGALWGMVALVLLVAAFGVTNTLTMNVLEQTRELGLLRIVAMTRDQVRKTIFAQALMMGLLALIPGIAAGVGVAYLINLATYPITGHPVEFDFHPLLLGGSFVLGMVVVAIAAWLPAERAARLSLPQALRYT